MSLLRKQKAHGADDGTCTHMNLHSLEPESSASANSATSAYSNCSKFSHAKSGRGRAERLDLRRCPKQH